MASRGVNKVIIIGRLGHDPEIRYSPSGTAFANLTVATSEQWRDKQTGEQKEQTEWHRVVMSGKLAEIASEYPSQWLRVSNRRMVLYLYSGIARDGIKDKRSAAQNRWKNHLRTKGE